MPFYVKLGYEVFDEDFIEVGIPHKHMQKYLIAKEEVEPRIEKQEEESKGSVSIKDFNSWL